MRRSLFLRGSWDSWEFRWNCRQWDKCEEFPPRFIRFFQQDRSILWPWRLWVLRRGGIWVGFCWQLWSWYRWGTEDSELGTTLKVGLGWERYSLTITSLSFLKSLASRSTPSSPARMSNLWTRVSIIDLIFIFIQNHWWNLKEDYFVKTDKMLVWSFLSIFKIDFRSICGLILIDVGGVRRNSQEHHLTEVIEMDLCWRQRRCRQDHHQQQFGYPHRPSKQESSSHLDRPCPQPQRLLWPKSHQGPYPNLRHRQSLRYGTSISTLRKSILKLTWWSRVE